MKQGDPTTGANSPEIDLTLSKQGSRQRVTLNFENRDLATAANPPEIDLALSTQGNSQ